MDSVLRTERSSLSARSRFRKSPAASFVRRQKNSARSSLIRCFTGVTREVTLALFGWDVVELAIIPTITAFTGVRLGHIAYCNIVRVVIFVEQACNEN
jgi:hypothetical protein